MWAPGNPIGRATALLPRAVGLLDAAERLVARIEALLDAYEPALRDAVPAVAHAGDRMAPPQFDALLRELDDALATVRTLGTVPPDLRELLAVSRGLNELMGSVPGLGRAKRRVDEELEELRTDDPPPAQDPSPVSPSPRPEPR